MCVCAPACARKVVIEADNGEIRPLTPSALTRTCDGAQASSAVSATHPGDALMTADGSQTPPLPPEAPPPRRCSLFMFYSRWLHPPPPDPRHQNASDTLSTVRPRNDSAPQVWSFA